MARGARCLKLLSTSAFEGRVRVIQEAVATSVDPLGQALWRLRLGQDQVLGALRFVAQIFLIPAFCDHELLGPAACGPESSRAGDVAGLASVNSVKLFFETILIAICDTSGQCAFYEGGGGARPDSSPPETPRGNLTQTLSTPGDPQGVGGSSGDSGIADD